MKVLYPKNFSKSRNQIILDYCKWKKVLHIWACDAPFTLESLNWEVWPLLYKEIDKVCSYQLWIDIDKESINLLNSMKDFKNSEIKYFDMNKLEDLNFKPDVIIFWEVIEHLMNLEIALTNLKKVMNENTLLIISTPNAFYIQNFVHAFFGFEYMHEDHKVLFSYWYLKNLLKFNWLKVEKGYFTYLDLTKKWWKKQNRRTKLFYFIGKIIPYYSSTLLFICKKEKK